MSNESILIGHVHTNLKKYVKGKKLLFSISGNKPSMVLLNLVPILRDKLEYEISVFNFNNPSIEISNLRSNLVKKFCESISVQWFEHVEELDINRENKRRASIKYNSLEIYNQLKANAIVGSVTKDIQIQTFLYELFIGTNINLLYRKTPKIWNDPVINPLITIESKIIDNYVIERNIQSVQSPPFTRHEKFVKFINEFYPQIKNFPDYLENISKFATNFKPEIAIIDETILLSSYLIDRQYENKKIGEQAKIKKITWKNFIQLENHDTDNIEKQYENAEVRTMLELSGIKESKISDEQILSLINLMKNAGEKSSIKYFPEFYQLEINSKEIIIIHKGYVAL